MLKRLNLTRDKLFSIGLTLVIFASLYIVGKSIPEEPVRAFVLSHGRLAPLVFVLLTFATYIIAPLSGTPLLYVGFFAFGINVIPLTIAAVFVASVTNFWIARLWGRKLVEKFAGSHSTDAIDKFTKNHGLLTLFLLRVFQGGINELVSYAAGLTSLRFWPYLAVSTIGLIPGNALWYFLALKVNSPAAFTALTLTIAAVFALLFVPVVLIIKKLDKQKFSY